MIVHAAPTINTHARDAEQLPASGQCLLSKEINSETLQTSPTGRPDRPWTGARPPHLPHSRRSLIASLAGFVDEVSKGDALMLDQSLHRRMPKPALGPEMPALTLISGLSH